MYRRDYYAFEVHEFQGADIDCSRCGLPVWHPTHLGRSQMDHMSDRLKWSQVLDRFLYYHFGAHSGFYVYDEVRDATRFYFKQLSMGKGLTHAGQALYAMEGCAGGWALFGPDRSKPRLRGSYEHGGRKAAW